MDAGKLTAQAVAGATWLGTGALAAYEAASKEAASREAPCKQPAG